MIILESGPQDVTSILATLTLRTEDTARMAENKIITLEDGGDFSEFHPGYFVNKQGSIYSLRAGRLLKPIDGGRGYFMVTFREGKKTKTVQIHRAVACAWIGPKPFPSAQIRHLNGIKADNRLENLAWGTPKENCQDRILHGVQARGERHGMASLSEGDARRLIAMVEFRWWGSRRISNALHLSKIFRLDISHTRKIIRGLMWGHLDRPYLKEIA